MSDQPTAEQDLVAALGALADPPKEGKVAAGQRRYTYLTLVDLLGAVRPVFAAHNLAVSQDVETRERGVSIVTVIRHASGQTFESSPLVLACSQDPQSVGSAITYGRRYQLGAMVGLAGEDDDGQAAQNPRGNTPEVFNQTRPVTRAKKTADDPADNPYQLPPAAPVEQSEMGDVGTPSTSTLASKKSTAMMWALKRDSPMTDAEFRTWVAQLFQLDSEDWHTADLTQAQVSAVIRRLQAAPGVGRNP
jgi:hypothetical protein